MKKTIIILLLVISVFPQAVSARSGCCSHHGGVSNSCSNGRQVCNDGTISPSCTCEDYSSYTPNNSSSSSTSSSKSVSTPSYIYGCTNSSALNYDPSATRDDGSCIEKVYGCMDSNARNYYSQANVSDSSCEYEREVTETKNIKYKAKYKYSDELEYNKEKVKQKGQLGSKEVTYKVVTDAAGNEISREKISENIIVEPVNKIIEKSSKSNPNDTALYILWIISLIIVLIYSIKHKDGNLLINKIQKTSGFMKLIWYIIYILFVIGPIIDLILIVINSMKPKSNIIKK